MASKAKNKIPQTVARSEMAFIPYNTATVNTTAINIKTRTEIVLEYSIWNTSAMVLDYNGVAREKVVAVPASRPTTEKISMILPGSLLILFPSKGSQAWARDSFGFFFTKKR